MTHHDAHDPKAAAERIAAEGESVRERFRRLVVDTMRNRKLSTRELGDSVEEMIDGAVAGLKESVPDRQDAVLGDVVEGLGDGLSASANATRLALEEARTRGESFAKEDIEKAIDDLKAIEKMFTGTVSNLTTKAGRELQVQAKDLGTHAKRTYERVRPAVESALSETARHPVKMARDTAEAGLRAAPKAAGMLLQAASGLLEGAADVLGGKDSTRKDERG